MVKIKNNRELVKNSRSPLDQKARRLALSGLESALKAADPRGIIKSKVALKLPWLKIDGKSFDLRSFENIFVVGGGSRGKKPGNRLGSRAEDGWVRRGSRCIDKHGWTGRANRRRRSFGGWKNNTPFLGIRVKRRGFSDGQRLLHFFRS